MVLELQESELTTNDVSFRQSLNSKQRQLRKNGGELNDNDQIELERITKELAVLQKQLDQSRKQSRQHSLLVQVKRVSQ